MLPLPKGATWPLLLLFCAALYINGAHSEGRVVCYYTNWSVYRPGTAKFNPQNINPYLCTHLIYAFGGFTKDNQMKPFDKYQDIEQGGYAKFTGLKTYNKQLKTMIAIGGWNEASSRFSPLVANSERRQKFIKNILKFLRQNHFDGIDLDWEYPAHREGGKPRDRDNYAQFVQELRAEFERESEKTGRSRLLVTMAVPAGVEYIEKGYDIPKLNKYLDWFNVLTYDFHSSHEPSVNHHAPLYSLEEDSEYNYDAELNIDYSIKFYLNAGADRDKLVLGIPTYGRSFTLINEESTEIGAPAEAPGEQGDATREKGYLAYYEICQNVKEDPEWTVVQPNPNAVGPYAYHRNQWVGYDDEAIVRKKAQYVVENGLGGIMFWAIDNDDFRGICTGKPYPLIEAAKEAMLDALGLGINEVSKPGAPQKLSRLRSHENSSSTRNRISTSEHKLTYAERKGSSKRTQTLQKSVRHKQQSTTTAASIKLTEAVGSPLYIGGRTTTPPPPTTPDPGADFKCEDEGFFQHPRDCKKYYWCLDSGPSGLGIVAHQFTCPSGLYFNPAADSCDFARNVPCKTKKSTPETTSTTARPSTTFTRLTAATSIPTTFFRTTPRTTTTTEDTEEDSEYSEEDEAPPVHFATPKVFDRDSEEDPKVIKELIELIRKVGGVEELEKHLLRKDDGTISIKESSSISSSSLTATTPPSISKSLYEKVLSKPSALNSVRNRFTSTSNFRTTKAQINDQENGTDETDSKSAGAVAGVSKYSSVVRGNSRQRPQSEGIDKLSEFDGLLREKKQYITINRNHSTKQNADEEDHEISTASNPAYSTIRRTRPTTTTEAIQKIEQKDKETTERTLYSTLNRSRVKSVPTTEIPEVTQLFVGSTRYKYLHRSRTIPPTTESSHKVADDEEDSDDIESDNQEKMVHFKAVSFENTRETPQLITTATQRIYANIERRTITSTTTIPEIEISTSADKILATTTASTPTISTIKTPLTTPLIGLDTTTPGSILLTTNIPLTTPTNPITISTISTETINTTTSTLPDGEDVLKSTITPNPNESKSNTSETVELAQHMNSQLINSILLNFNSPPTTEFSSDINERNNDRLLTTTEMTLSSTTTRTAVNDSVNATKTEDTAQKEVNLVSKQTSRTLYNTRTRITTTTSPKIATTTYVDIKTTTSPLITTNTKKTLGVKRQQILLSRFSQTKGTSSTATTDIPTTSTTESVNNDFLGVISSPRPFGFPKRRRPLGKAGIVTTTAAIEDISKSNDESLARKQNTTKLNAAANSHSKLRTPTTVNINVSTVTRRPVLSVRRRLIVPSSTVSSQAADNLQTTSPSFSTFFDLSSTINDEYSTASKFSSLHSNPNLTSNTVAADMTTDTIPATSSFKTNNKLKIKPIETSSNDLKLVSSSLTSLSSADNHIAFKQAPTTSTSAALRRRFQAKRLTSISTTTMTTISDIKAAKPPRTQNLLNRRYTLTTYSPLPAKSKEASKTATTSRKSLPIATESLTTAAYVDCLENDEATDQVAKSSIHTSHFNQIKGRLHINREDEDELNDDSDGIKFLTTSSPVTKNPASRFLHQQSSQQLHLKLSNDDVITRRMYGGTDFVSKSSTANSTPSGSIISTSPSTPTIIKRKMIIKRKPHKNPPISEDLLPLKKRPYKYQEMFDRISNNQSKSALKTSTQPVRAYSPNFDYDYYDDENIRLVGNKSDQQLKVILHGSGIIECLDQGNFPHPLSCRKFISCAKSGVVGWEYTCPKGLSYDPVGSMCNWAAGLGCKE